MGSLDILELRKAGWDAIRDLGNGWWKEGRKTSEAVTWSSRAHALMLP